LLLGFAGVWQLQRKIDVWRVAFEQEQDELVVRSAKLTKIASMEFATLMADLYWTQAVQYYGNKRLRHEAGLGRPWPVPHITAPLCPNFSAAYDFWSAFLAAGAPAGGGRPESVVALIERGSREYPEYLRFYPSLGYIYYFFAHDFAKSSEA